MRLAAFLLVLAAAPSASGSAAFDLRQPASQPCLLHDFAGMLRDANQRIQGSEVAAFLVVAPDGSLSLSRWRSVAGVWEERFQGVLPEGTIGVVHTHPVARDRPSAGDVGEAIRTGLPIYVVSHWKVWVVDPGSGRSLEIAGRTWRRTASLCASKSPEYARHSRRPGRRP